MRSILRRYTGWYNGNPSNLFPSASAEIAEEVLGLAGGAGEQEPSFIARNILSSAAILEKGALGRGE